MAGLPELFPETALEDELRFWSPALLAYELERRGLEPSMHIDCRRTYVAIAEVLGDIERRELSQLAILVRRLRAWPRSSTRRGRKEP